MFSCDCRLPLAVLVGEFPVELSGLTGASGRTIISDICKTNLPRTRKLAAQEIPSTGRGAEAFHLLQGSPGPPGPARPPKSIISEPGGGFR